MFTRGSYCSFAGVLDRLVPLETQFRPQNLEAQAELHLVAVSTHAATSAVIFNISEQHSLSTVVTLCGVHKALALTDPAQAGPPPLTAFLTFISRIDHSHSYTHLILALCIVREPTIWGFITSKYIFDEK